MNIWKSLIVIFFLLGMISLSLYQVTTFLKGEKPSKCSYVMNGIKSVILCSITIVMVVSLADYTYPFDRNVEIELVATVEVPEEEQFVNPGIWYGVYKEGVMCPGSDTFHPTFIDKWVEIDLGKYSYIVSFGQQVNSLRYNIWDHHYYDRGIKTGKIELSQHFEPTRIYIYRIDKVRIDNSFTAH